MLTAADFKERMVAFLDELIAQFPERSIILLAKTVVQNQHATVIVEKFHQQIFPLKDLIEQRNSELLFQRGNNYIDDHTYKEILQQIELIWTSLDEANQSMIWEWFDSFLYISNKLNT